MNGKELKQQQDGWQTVNWMSKKGENNCENGMQKLRMDNRGGGSLREVGARH